MANVKKFSRGAVGNMFGHFERKVKENGELIKYGNQEINTDLSYKNYNLNVSDKKPIDIYHDRLNQVKCLNRADVKTFCSWVITIPKDLENTEKQEDFFKNSYDFLADRYGKNNVVSSFVHLDETTPHMHFCFVPVVMDKKKNIEKVSAKEVLTKKELLNFHKDFKKYLDDKMGVDVKVLTGKTEMNKTIKELKQETIKKYQENEKNALNFDFDKKDNEIIKQIDLKAKNKGIFDKTRVIDVNDVKKILKNYISKFEDLKWQVNKLSFENKCLNNVLEMNNNSIRTLYKEKTELQEKLQNLENSKNIEIPTNNAEKFEKNKEITEKTEYENIEDNPRFNEIMENTFSRENILGVQDLEAKSFDELIKGHKEKAENLRNQQKEKRKNRDLEL